LALLARSRSCRSFSSLRIVDVARGLRVSEEQETDGLDIRQHEEKAYNN